MNTHYHAMMRTEASNIADKMLQYLKENYKAGDRVTKISLRIQFDCPYNVATMAFAILQSKGVPMSLRSIVIPNFGKPPVAVSAQTS